MKLEKLLIAALLCFTIIPKVKSQSNIPLNKSHSLFDKITGIDNTDLFNGVIYNETFRNTEQSHVFFNSPKFSPETITYNSQTYYNVMLKYDIYNDILLTKLNEEKSYLNVQLISDKVGSFTIDTHKFINTTISNQLKTLEIFGFMEEAYEGEDLKFYIKHRKKPKRSLEKRMVDANFIKDNIYILLYNNSFYRIKSIKDVKRIILNKSEDIKSIQRQYKYLQKNDTDNFMTLFFNQLDNRLISSKH